MLTLFLVGAFAKAKKRLYIGGLTHSRGVPGVNLSPGKIFRQSKLVFVKGVEREVPRRPFDTFCRTTLNADLE